MPTRDDADMTPRLEKCFTLRLYIDQEHTVNLKGITSSPMRIIVPITHGSFEGAGLHAIILPGGSDWVQRDTALNISHIDVRTQARTAAGDSFYIHFTGVLAVDEAAAMVLGWRAEAKTTAFGDHYFFNAPIMETSSAAFKCVVTTLFVGQGRFVVEDGGKARAIEYQIFKVVN